MRGRRGSREAPQNQVMVRVVLRVPDRHIMEQTTKCAQDVVGTGSHLPSTSVHGPCLAVLQSRLMPWEEMSAYVL